MGFSSRFFGNSSTKMFVKIVKQGGHAELHDTPILAAEIMFRSPKCCITYPNIFKQPWAVVAPDTMLMLGQKFYVVPFSTIRKLQHHFSKYSSNVVHEIQSSDHQLKDTEEAENCLVCLQIGGKIKGNGQNSGCGTRLSGRNYVFSERKELARKKSNGVKTKGKSVSRKRDFFW